MDRRQFLYFTLASVALFCRRLCLRDDTAYLQGLIDSQRGRRVVNLPRGEYNVFQPLRINGTGARFIDGNSIKLKWRGNHTDDGTLVLYGNLTGCEVRDFWIVRGPRAAMNFTELQHG